MNARTATAAVYRGAGPDVEITEITVAAPRRGEVLVEIRASGVCGSDRHVIDGEWHVPSPTVMGHEGAGIIVELGADVTGLAVGDHVSLVWNQACQRCVNCQSGKPWACTDLVSNDCVMPDGTTRLARGEEAVYPYLAVGSMSEYAVVPASAAIRMPSELPFEIAALISCSIHTGLGAVQNNARVSAGESSVVVGCGGVGLSIVMGLRLAGAHPIIAVDRNPEKLALALEAGATHALLADEHTAAQIQELTAGGADVAFEAIGNPRTIQQLPGHVRLGGRAVLVGMPPEDAPIPLDVLDLCYRGITVIASNYGGGVPARDFPRYAALYLDGRLPLDALVSHRISIHDVNEAFRVMRSGADARSVIVFEGANPATA
ncbi:zinc-binding dehydrogenase [Leucobacter luti]|uniref:S-(Hydroxymethyl)glutathione dehydrogenase/alcohol dehydrogenase n=1 Tax=Leucobacter luti TaxID=340320 RepID=A0A4Q7U455_9MICO|nr:zinc-binding dehydrogenase [Leucobacter luti]MBL3699432.1 alcohol dehydrogenase [Leucobacter luti]RZT66942.1 S-(hydroxymethyl)glutathione dehydrogenase/alcohol dehydrogenase [Leucobacter luti]